MQPTFIWIGIFLCLSQSAILSGLDLACFALSRVQLEIESSDNNKDAIKVLDLWLGPEGVHYLREQMLKQYIVKSVGASGSDIDTFEGRGAVNFLALDSRRVGEEGQVVDPSSVVSLPFVDGRLEVPEVGNSSWESFVQRVRASLKKWVILTDPDGAPHLLLNADRLLRAVSSGGRVDPHDYCVRRIITNDPQATLEQTLMSAKLAESKPTERGIILFWSTEKRIIAHADVLRRLFEGVFSPPPSPEQGGPYQKPRTD